MNSLYLKLITGAAGIIVVLGLVLYIQHLQGNNAKLTLERNEARTELAAKTRSLKALQQAAIERTADNTRIDAAEKGLRDDLERIERAIPEGAPRPVPDASSVAITCRRLLRTGQTQSPEYRASCR